MTSITCLSDSGNFESVLQIIDSIYTMMVVQAREVYSKELKGSISAIASLQGHLLVAIGPKIILHSWSGSELNGTAFFDAPLYVVSLNIVSLPCPNHSECCSTQLASVQTPDYVLSNFCLVQWRSKARPLPHLLLCPPK